MNCTSKTQAPTFSDPYLYIGGDICTNNRCECHSEDITCVGDDIWAKWEECASTLLTIEQEPHPTLVNYYFEYVGAGSKNDTEATDTDTTQRRRPLLMQCILAKANENARTLLKRFGEAANAHPDDEFHFYGRQFPVTMGHMVDELQTQVDMAWNYVVNGARYDENDPSWISAKSLFIDKTS